MLAWGQRFGMRASTQIALRVMPVRRERAPALYGKGRRVRAISVPLREHAAALAAGGKSAC